MKRTNHRFLFLFIVLTLAGATLSAGGARDASGEAGGAPGAKGAGGTGPERPGPERPGPEAQAEPRVLSVYCYDSFSSEWGPGPIIAAAFTEATGIEILLNAPGDGVTVLNQLILEKDDPRADVVVGLDDALLDRALTAGVLEPYEAAGLENVDDALIFDRGYHLLPYDYGHFAINFDTASSLTPPGSLEELTGLEYADRLIVMDPRTSTPGLGFFLWTAAVYGEDWPDYWRRLRPNILTVADGWSQGYALYTAGEAPLVVSYGTSPVYHLEYEESERFAALEFSDGHVRQIEGMGIVKGTAARRSAEEFIEFMLGEEAQKALATANIMLPVNSRTELPESFGAALRPGEVLDVRGLGSARRIEGMIREWVEVFGG